MTDDSPRQEPAPEVAPEQQSPIPHERPAPEGKDSIQAQVEAQQAPHVRKYGMIEGVFIPTLLTILGVIMFLRLGWVVGNAGLLGAVGIIVLAFTITITTGLSIATIATNIRVGAGGAYSMISQSLGLEVGGSIGVPLYLSQALAVAMYIFGFREGWMWIFPEHPALLVDMVTLGTLFTIAYISAGFAFRIQYVILAIIAGSLISVAAAAAGGSMVHEITWIGEFPGEIETGFEGTNFWFVFAVFFPAATGIMAGTNMSGELENPRKSIPIGTMLAIVVSLVIYLVLAYWLARSATMEELLNNYTIMIDRAAWGPLVLAGLLGATFSSGLASLVGAPRILQALGSHNILPRSDWLSQRSAAGEPRNAMLVTGGIVLAALMVRDLNAVAPLITLFFLITYCMINVVVLIEQRLDLVSFRPLFEVPPYVPLVGTVSCLAAMFIVNPVFALVAVTVVIAFYGFLVRRQIDAPYGDMRSGLFVAVGEWAADRISGLPEEQERAWKPNLLVPVESPQEFQGVYRFIHAVAYPKGSVKVIGITPNARRGPLSDRLDQLCTSMRGEGVFTTASVVEADSFGSGVVSVIQTLGGVAFRPNSLFLTVPATEQRRRALKRILPAAREGQMGIIMVARHPESDLGARKRIHVWLRDRSPDWDLHVDMGNLDLALLLAIKLRRNWQGQIRIATVVETPDQLGEAQAFLENLTEVARIPRVEITAAAGSFRDQVKEAKDADIHIFGLQDDIDPDFMREMVSLTGASCLFVRDSGTENVLA